MRWGRKVTESIRAHPRGRLPTLAEVEVALGIPASDWAGHCHEIANAIVEAGLVDGHAVYGDWRGEISTESHFAADRGMPFRHHGWIVLKDGRVFDPTRWAFEGKKPYLYVGTAGPEYDEGGNRLRSENLEPPPQYRAADRVVPTEGMPPLGLLLMKELLDDPPAITAPMLFWVANLPVDALGPHAVAIFEAIDAAGYDAIVPVDNRALVARRAEARTRSVAEKRAA